MEEQQRGFKGIWLPAEIWQSEDLTKTEMLLLAEIDSLCSPKSRCYASNHYFAKFFKLSKSRISKLISNLVKKGYVDIELIYKNNSQEVDKRFLSMNKAKIYGIVDNSYTPMGENDYTPMVKNSEEYNKDNNNKDIIVNKYIGCCSKANNQQTFDPRITDRHLRKLTAYDTDLQSDMLEVFRYFFLRYDDLYGMAKHPRISEDTLERIISNFGIAYIGYKDTEETDVGVDDYKGMIDRYIGREFKYKVDGVLIPVDHSIVHFFEQKVINGLAHEVWNV